MVTSPFQLSLIGLYTYIDAQLVLWLMPSTILSLYVVSIDSLAIMLCKSKQKVERKYL